MPWYDTFASFYDQTVESIYRPYRPRIVEALRLEAGDAALDLACGTGPNLPYLSEAVGPDGQVFGVDLSEGMLARAQRQVARLGLAQVRLLQRDAREISRAELEAAARGTVRLTGAVVALGLSVIPDWEAVFEAAFSLLEPGGRFVIFDVHARRRVPQSWVVERMAQADLSREVWRPLERMSEGFALEELPGSPHVHGGQLLLASGIKPPLSAA